MGRVARGLWLAAAIGACAAPPRRPKLPPVPPPNALPTPRQVWRATGLALSLAVPRFRDLLFVRRGAKIAALEIATGEPRWEVPAATPDGRLLGPVGVRLIEATPGGTLHAYAVADGGRQWKLDVKCPPGEAFLSAETAAAVVCGGSVLGLDTENGRQLWQAPLDDRPAAVRASDETAVYVVLRDKSGGPAGGNSVLLALEWSTGDERWRAAVPDAVTNVAVGAGVVVALGQQAHAFRAKSGKPAWAYEPDRYDAAVYGPLRTGDPAAMAAGMVLLPRPEKIKGVSLANGKLKKSWAFPSPPPPAMGEGGEYGEPLPIVRLAAEDNRVVAWIGNRKPDDPVGYLVTWEGEKRRVLRAPVAQPIGTFAGDVLLVPDPAAGAITAFDLTAPARKGSR